MNELPEGWTSVPLTTLCTFSYGSSAKSGKVGDVPVLRMGNIQNGEIDWSDLVFTSDPAEIARFTLEPNTVLFNRTNSPELVGKTAIYRGGRPAVFAGYLIKITPVIGLDSDYLNFFLNSNIAKELCLRAKSDGVSQSNINATKLGAFQIPFCPPDEQQRIVVKTRTLLANVQSCKDRLDKIPMILKRFRQAVLAAACDARLTADWRQTHPKVKSAQGVVDALKTEDPEAHFTTFEDSSLGELPDTWTWVRLGKLGKMVGGGTPSKENAAFWGGKIPWVSPKDMKRDRIADAEDHITPAALAASATREIPVGSILFVTRGMILNHTLPTAITDRVVTLNQDMKALLPEVPTMSEYLFIASKHIARQILFEVKEATHGTRRVETPLLKNWAVPLPPVEEQQEIVRRVNAMMTLADRLAARHKIGAAHVDKLTQSILAKAFRGELVPTEAELARREGRSYETAKELLARIKSTPRSFLMVREQDSRLDSRLETFEVGFVLLIEEVEALNVRVDLGESGERLLMFQFEISTLLLQPSEIRSVVLEDPGLCRDAVVDLLGHLAQVCFGSAILWNPAREVCLDTFECLLLPCYSRLLFFL
jgi:type I restriction enzyme S subunit